MLERITPEDLFPQVRNVSPNVSKEEGCVKPFDVIDFHTGYPVVRDGDTWFVWWVENGSAGWTPAGKNEQKLYNDIFTAFNP